MGGVGGGVGVNVAVAVAGGLAVGGLGCIWLPRRALGVVGMMCMNVGVEIAGRCSRVG